MNICNSRDLFNPLNIFYSGSNALTAKVRAHQKHKILWPWFWRVVDYISADNLNPRNVLKYHMPRAL